MTTPYALAFEPFLLDLVAGGLYDHAGAKPLTPKAYALLEYLTANAGRLVSKRELLDVLWPRAYVTDGVLKVCVREIRRALADDARAPRFIETAHRRGYRFIAPVASVPPVLASSSVSCPIDVRVGTRPAAPPPVPLTSSSLLANRSLMNCVVAGR
jgi:DNA-binding winged helix-turn-helix (wHTH) protein